MTQQEQSLDILIQVALLAQSKGILSLEDAVVVKQAIETFKSPVNQEAPQVEAAPAKEVLKAKTLKKA